MQEMNFRIGAKCNQFSNISLRNENNKQSSVVLVHSSLSSSSSSTNRLIDYSRGWAWQQVLLSRRLAFRRETSYQSCNTPLSDKDAILMLEHNPVYTLGRGADENHLTFMSNKAYNESRTKLSRSFRGTGAARLLIDRQRISDELNQCSDQEIVERLSKMALPVVAPNGVPIYRVERGGEVTFHGPGQLVVYPLFDLQKQPFKEDLRWYLFMLEEAIILSLRHYNIEGQRDSTNTGVWVNGQKIAAVGVSASRWITTHGFALNVCPNMMYFDESYILPCGLEGKGVTSICKIIEQQDFTRSTPTIENVSEVVLKSLQQTFCVEVETGHTIQ